MKLRTGMLLGIVALVVAIVASTALAVAFVVDRAERRKLDEDLDRSQRVFDELLGYRASKARSDCHVVANEPRARSVLGTEDMEDRRSTIVGVMTELRDSLGSDLFLLTDRDGILIGDIKDPKAEGFDLSKQPAIASAIKTGDGAAFWVSEGRLYQVSACRVDISGETLGLIAIGHAVDDAFTQAFHRQTGSTLLVSLDTRLVAVSPLDGNRKRKELERKLDKLKKTAGEGKLTEQEMQGLQKQQEQLQKQIDEQLAGERQELQKKLEQLAAEKSAPLGASPTDEHDLAGDRYLARGGPFRGYEGQRPLRYAVMRSLDEALAPGRRLTRTVFVIAALALGAAVGIAFALSRRMSRPVDDLVRFTHAIGKGELERRATPAGATEVQALAKAMNTMVEELERSRRSLAEKQRLERELEIASRIQTSILPKRYDVAGLEIAARMIPASEVGGDYYDVFAMGDGCWVGIGDVAGHGLSAGLEMLMVQSVVAALVRHAPRAAPSDHVRVLNQVLYDNIRDRLGQDEHITMTLMRYEGGVFTFAGAHEEILVCRAADGSCEYIPTPGTWLGGMRDISRVTRDNKLELQPGDLMVLYTDGITEAQDGSRAQFGGERLARTVEQHRNEPVAVVRDRVIEAVQAWQAVQDDDISIVVIRRQNA
jgi:sigma-B regulation protein RsbU (phosphoserine phosphatase)